MPAENDRGWTARDIDENRSGRLSRAQADLIREQKKLSLALYLGVPMIGLQIGLVTLTGGKHAGGVESVLAVVTGVAILAGTALASLYLWRRKGTLAHERVTAVDGRVVWDGPVGGWVPVGMNGARLAVAAGGPVLSPGPYRFYFHDDRLVGAESPLDATRFWSIAQIDPFKLGAASGPRPPPLPIGNPEALRAGLASLLGFTADDLAHHRRGELSPRQGVGRVVAVEGTLAYAFTMHSRSSVTYHWDVGGRRFDIPLGWISKVPYNVVYRCYVDERSQRLLSLEPLGVADVDPSARR